MANLRDVAELTQLPSLPPRPRNQEEGRLVSIFSLALLRVKVTKDLEKTADGNGREMRQSHAPLWAKEAMRLNDFLRNVAENVHCLNDDDDASGDGTEIPIGVLRVRRLMSSDEHSKLDDF